MTDRITLTLPEKLSSQVRQIAAEQAQAVEDMVVSHLERSLPELPSDIQTELDALHYLSDDALWTIAREQLPDTIQQKAHTLMTRNTRGIITADEKTRLQILVDRSDRLMLRKAEAAVLLQARGYAFEQSNFSGHDE